MILYLHGFKSSPLSYKAQLIAGKLAEFSERADYIAPQLPESPKKCIELVLKLAEPFSVESITLIGSSLGGYYTNWIAEKMGCRAVLLNPVIDPWKIKILEDSPDPSNLQIREWFEFTEKYNDELHTLQISHITKPKRYMLIAAKGDELLDWHLMASHYQGARQIIINGSDHGLSDFEYYLKQVFGFAEVKAAKS